MEARKFILQHLDPKTDIDHLTIGQVINLMEYYAIFYHEKQVKNCNIAVVSNRPSFGLVEMAVHDFFTTHNGFQEITDQEGESYTMEFLESHKEWLGISDDC